MKMVGTLAFAQKRSAVCSRPSHPPLNLFDPGSAAMDDMRFVTG